MGFLSCVEHKTVLYADEVTFFLLSPIVESFVALKKPITRVANEQKVNEQKTILLDLG